ncbi:hypothetical protein A2771_03710 [Candidatus Woesebacteria bacterium RIFCSPHIGHO2_01_FULL_38_26b]|uniref:Uncharacterized protein n=1 Tax=Candidatus Woesebacteria bacterium RIFCSPHIGHO2_01_FULL_38_26b TaxID=1802491 RepID=A0A1F7XYH8_9BACT|nr:MAG: hypothetical protein A2771_03710 [Candidatus Woesebacteria bacterium RIFCSPHIGHO2_01_FULL_38_26b]
MTGELKDGEIQGSEEQRKYIGFDVRVPEKAEGKYGFVRLDLDYINSHPDILEQLDEPLKARLTEEVSQGGLFLHRSHVSGLSKEMELVKTQIVPLEIAYNLDKQRFYVAKAATLEFMQEAEKELKPDIVDIRRIEKGKGGNLTLGRGREEKVILWDNSLPQLPPGTLVAVTLYDEKEKVRIARGFSLKDRMILDFHSGAKGGQNYYMAGEEYATHLTIPKAWIEAKGNEQDHTYWVSVSSSMSGYHSRYELVREEKEEVIKRMFVWSAFADILENSLGLRDIYNESSPKADVPDSELPEKWKYEDKFVNALFRPANPSALIAGNMAGKSEDLKTIIEKHFVPMKIWQRKIERGEIEGVEKFNFHTAFRQHANDFFTSFKSPKDVEPEAVLKFLLERETKFPWREGEDGYDIFGVPIKEREIIDWSFERFGEAEELRDKLIKHLVDHPQAIIGKYKPGDFYSFWMENGRKPEIGDFVDFDKVNELYPDKIEVPGIGKRKVRYRVEQLGSDGERHIATLSINEADLFNMTGLPVIKGAEAIEVWGKPVMDEGELSKHKRYRREILFEQKLKDYLKEEKPDSEQVLWSNENDDPPKWEVPKTIEIVEGVGDLKVYPNNIVVTIDGIVSLGIIGDWDEKATKEAKEDFELMAEVWRARRGQLSGSEGVDQSEMPEFKSNHSLLSIKSKRGGGEYYLGDRIKRGDYGLHGPKLEIKEPRQLAMVEISLTRLGMQDEYRKLLDEEWERLYKEKSPNKGTS